MSSVSIRLDGEVEQLLARLNQMAGIDKAGVMNAIAEGLRTSTLERFRSEESPEGTRWRQRRADTYGSRSGTNG